MDDREKLTILLTEFQVGFELEDGDIICREGANRVSGYGGFFTVFYFNADGSFKEMGAGE